MVRWCWFFLCASSAGIPACERRYTNTLRAAIGSRMSERCTILSSVDNSSPNDTVLAWHLRHSVLDMEYTRDSLQFAAADPSDSTYAVSEVERIMLDSADFSLPPTVYRENRNGGDLYWVVKSGGEESFLLFYQY